MFVSSIITIVLNAIILRYIYELEAQNCDCALHWMHQFIKYFASIVIAMSLFGLVVPKRTLIKLLWTNKPLLALMSLYFVAAVAYYIILIVYFAKLVKTKCDCSDDWKRWGLLYPAVSIGISLLITLVVTIFAMAGNPRMLNKLKSRKLANSKLVNNVIRSKK
jgi:hypothetical protein